MLSWGLRLLLGAFVPEKVRLGLALRLDIAFCPEFRFLGCVLRVMHLLMHLLICRFLFELLIGIVAPLDRPCFIFLNEIADTEPKIEVY